VRPNPGIDIETDVVRALKAVLGEGLFSLHQPCLAGNEKNYLAECVDSSFVSSVGKYVDQFEKDLARYTGAKYAVAVVNGTAALQTCLVVSGVRPGDEVLVPSLSFVATSNAVVHAGAIPHFVDVSERTLGVDPDALSQWLDWISEKTSEGLRNKVTGRRISCLIPMHTFGHVCDLEALVKIAFDAGIMLVEDAAESLGSTYQGQHAGTFGICSALSFNGNKIVTTGGGGALLTNDHSIATHAKHLTTTAKVPHAWNYVHDEIGYNFRMPNINAALGCAQLEQIDKFLSNKRRLAKKYAEAFHRVPSAHWFAEPDGSASNYWLQTILLDKVATGKKESLLMALKESGYESRPVWTPNHLLFPYASCPKSPLGVTESLADRIVNIPSNVEIE